MESLANEAAKLVARKIVTLLIVLLLILTIEFLFIRVGAGVESYIPKGATPALNEAIREKLHLNDSIVVQYFYFIGDMLSGGGSFDMLSTTSHRPVGDVVDDAFPRTVILFVSSLLISLLLGLLCAHVVRKMRSPAGKALSMATMFVVWAVPVFFFASLFLIQIVWRFDLEWAVINPLHPPGPGWLDHFIHDVGQRVFPILILTIVSFGGFSLIALQGIRRSSQTILSDANASNARQPSFSECIVSVMPSMKLNLAFIMSCALFLEGFWILDGLGYRVYGGTWNNDMPLVEVAVFLILLIVLISGFTLDLAFSILALRSPRNPQLMPADLSQAAPVDKEPEKSLTPLPGDLAAEVKWFLSCYARTPIGIVGGILLVAVAFLAVVGPLVAEPYSPLSTSEPDPVSEFLLGFRDPFSQTFVVLLLSMVIGFMAALLTMPLGKFSYPVVLVAEGFLVFPIVGMILMSNMAWMGWNNAYSIVLVTWAPIALVVLIRTKSLNDSYSARFPTETGLTRYRGMLTKGVSRTLPDAVAALKVVSVVGMLSALVYDYSLFRPFHDGSWGSMLNYSVQEMLLFEFDLWWILPLIGVVVMVSAFYLVLQATQDALEKRFRSAVEASPSQLSSA